MSRVLLAASLFLYLSHGAEYPKLAEGDFVMRDFHFQSGQSLPELRMHYTTIGTPGSDAVLLLHGTGGSGVQFQSKQFADELFRPGQLLDANTHYIVMPDNIGHGKSSKPSDGLRAKFPNYGYRDMLISQYRLLTEHLGVTHLRLVLGTSMGCMHAWMWGGQYPRFMDALMPLGCLPYPITGRNFLWRRIAVEVIRSDPQYRNGNYTQEPHAVRTANEIQTLMTSSTLDLQKRGDSREDSKKLYQQLMADPRARQMDANDYIYAVESSADYDPRPLLTGIKAAVFAVNFADDPVNPPELGIFERELSKLPNVNHRVVPGTTDTHGHGTHTWAVFWKQYLADLLQAPEPNR